MVAQLNQTRGLASVRWLTNADHDRFLPAVAEIVAQTLANSDSVNPSLQSGETTRANGFLDHCFNAMFAGTRSLAVIRPTVNRQEKQPEMLSMIYGAYVME